MMQSPTAATVKPSTTLIVSSRCGSRGAGAGGCCATIATLASTRTDPTSGAPRMEPPWRKNSGPKNKGPGTEIRSPGHDVAVAGRADSTHQRAGSRVDHDPLDGAHAAHVAHVELMALRGQAVAHVLREHLPRQELPEDVVRIVGIAEAADTGHARAERARRPGREGPSARR